MHGGLVTESDVAAWPYSVDLLFQYSSFLGSSHWPFDSGDLGHCGGSYLELLILFEQSVTGCSVKKLFGHMNVFIALFLFLQRFGRDVCSLALWFERLVRCPVASVGILTGCVILAESTALMVSPPDPRNTEGSLWVIGLSGRCFWILP